MKIVLSICSILAIAAYTEAQDVLLKIPFKNEADLHALPWRQLIVRYEDSDFIIAEAGAAEQLYELDLPSYTILDYIEPDDRYYLVQIANVEQLAAIEKYGDVILRFRQSAAVVRGDAKDEASLLSLGLFVSSLSNNYVSSPTLRQPIVPRMVNFVIYPNPITFGNSKQLHIQYELSRDAGTTIEIYTISGKLVYQIEFASGETGGHTGLNDIPWPGENQVGERVASGVYICRVVVEDDQDAVEEKIKKIAVLR